MPSPSSTLTLSRGLLAVTMSRLLVAVEVAERDRAWPDPRREWARSGSEAAHAVAQQHADVGGPLHSRRRCRAWSSPLRSPSATAWANADGRVRWGRVAEVKPPAPSPSSTLTLPLLKLAVTRSSVLAGDGDHRRVVDRIDVDDLIDRRAQIVRGAAVIDLPGQRAGEVGAARGRVVAEREIEGVVVGPEAELKLVEELSVVGAGVKGGESEHPGFGVEVELDGELSHR